MMVNRAYKVKLYPNKEQSVKLQAIIDASRFVFNYYLNERKNFYLENKKTLKYTTMAKDLTQNRKEFLELYGIQAEPLQQSLRRLDTAYNSFFRKTSRFPKFKSRFDIKQSFQKHQDWRMRDNKIQIQGDLIVKFRGFINEKAELGTLVIMKENNKWYASITAKIEVITPNKFTKPIGIDVGLKDLAILSTGKKYKNIQPQKTLQVKLSKAQKELARKQKGSKRREQAKLVVNRIYEKIRNQRKNYLHKVSREIVNNNPSLIAVEDLNIKGMMANRKVARAFGDASVGELLRQLEYKQIWNGGEFIKIDRFFPSSKTCSNCKFILEKLTLAEREWECPKCHIMHDRDINASRVILAQSLAYSERGGSGMVSARKE